MRLKYITVFAVLISAGVLFYGCSGKEEKKESPTEDLLREHAVISRLLLIFDANAASLRSNAPANTQSIIQTCDILRSFVQNYHEKNEEEYVFTSLEKKGRMNDITGVLRQQHQVGRQLVDDIRNLASGGSLQDPAARAKLAGFMESFGKMYRPHKAWEGTVVFPAYYDSVSADTLDSVGEKFEKNEKKLFGKNGFENIVNKVGEIEKPLGIYDLSGFTPKLTQ